MTVTVKEGPAAGESAAPTSAQAWDSAQSIGRVVSVSGGQVICLLDAPTAAAGGNRDDTLQIGSLVKLAATRNSVFGIVGGLSIPIPSRDGTDELRIIEVELVGEIIADGADGLETFRRGVSTSPGLGDAVYAASQDELIRVYQPRSKDAIEIGHLQQNPTVPAHAVVDDLLGKHFSILGTTGAGKSCTVSLILNAIIEKHDNAHILLLDPHAEYARAFGDAAEVIEPDDLMLPHWLFTFEEIVEIVFGAEADELITEIAILRDLIQKSKIRFLGATEEANIVTVDTPVPYKIGDMLRLLDQTMGRLENRGDLTPFQRVKNRLNALQSDRRFSFMFPSGVVVRDNLSDILSRIFRVPTDGKPIAIMNLSGVPSEVLNVVVSVLARMTFDFALWNDHSVPLLLVCEEAHRYAPRSAAEGFEPTKRALARIAKEGRKYGVSLGVVAQRPSEVSTSVLSQCNTIFAMRMTSEKDQDFLRAAMSDATSGLLDSLPTLGNGEAIAVGEGVAVPMRLAFATLPEDKRPKSSAARFSSTWQTTDPAVGALDQVVERWRQFSSK